MTAFAAIGATISKAKSSQSAEGSSAKQDTAPPLVKTTHLRFWIPAKALG